AQLDALEAGVQHGAAPGEVDPRLHRHAHRGNVALDAGTGLHLDRREGADVAVDPALDHGLLHFDVRPHDPVLAHLEAVAVQDIALELAVDAQRPGDHERAAQGGAHADHGVGLGLPVAVLRSGAELHHRETPFAEPAGTT